MPDIDLLRSLGDQIVPPPFDELEETARRRTRRTTTAAVALAASVLAVGAGATALITPSDPRTAEPSDAPDYVLLLDDDSDPDQVEGRAGTYALTARGAGSPPLAVLDVPDGFSNFGFFALWPFGSGEQGTATQEPFRAVQYWTVHGVFPDPCRRAGEVTPASGGSVQQLTRALTAQKRTAASTPVPVTLDGHPGLYLELTVPRGVRIDECDLGYYAFWEGQRGDAQHVASAPGAVEHTWILDVDGHRVVLVAITDPDVSDAQTDEVIAMVESVRFAEPQ